MIFALNPFFFLNFFGRVEFELFRLDAARGVSKEFGSRAGAKGASSAGLLARGSVLHFFIYFFFFIEPLFPFLDFLFVDFSSCNYLFIENFSFGSDIFYSLKWRATLQLVYLTLLNVD